MSSLSDVASSVDHTEQDAAFMARVNGPRGNALGWDMVQGRWRARASVQCDVAVREPPKEEGDSDNSSARRGTAPGETSMSATSSPSALCGAGESSVNMLTKIEPPGLNTIDDDGWEEVELVVDSGATENVVGEDMLQSVDTKTGIAAKRGVEYEVANGVRMPNLGEKRFKCTSTEGVERELTMQVCEVNKGLLSVSKIAQKQHRVVFDDEGSYIEDKATNEKLWLLERGGMYILKVWVRKEGF